MNAAGVFALALICGGGPAFAAPPCSDARVDLRWPGGSESFAVELADTAEERSKGLMFRESLDPASGMLFVYETPQRAAFWMQNTLIPLDMIFADTSGRVTVVHSNAVPLDQTPIDGGDGVRFVLEINGGLAAKLGIVPGAELRHPSIGETAGWTCN